MRTTFATQQSTYHIHCPRCELLHVVLAPAGTLKCKCGKEFEYEIHHGSQQKKVNNDTRKD